MNAIPHPWFDLTLSSIAQERHGVDESAYLVDLSHALRDWMQFHASCTFPQLYLKAYTDGTPKVFLTFGIDGEKPEGGVMPYAATLEEAVQRFKTAFEAYVLSIKTKNSEFPNCPDPVAYWRRYPYIEKNDLGWRIRARFVMSY